MEFPQCPASLKQIQHFLKIALEHDTRDVVVAYWSRLYALQVALKISTQQPEETKLLLALMDWLESTKKENMDNEAISNEVAAQAHLENYALKLFLYADKQDREANFGKNVVKAFYSSGVLYDVLQTFGELTDEAIHNRKYAKWKAAYIHNCLKNGETPIPGPMPEQGEGETDETENAGDATEASAADDAPESTPASMDDNNIADSAINEAQPSSPSLNPSPTSTTPPTADEVLNDPDKLPMPPFEEEKPGGFEPFVPPAQPHPVFTPPTPSANVQITPDQMIKAQKYSKYASSALNYDDVKTAVENLQKALTILTTGEDA